MQKAQFFFKTFLVGCLAFFIQCCSKDEPEKSSDPTLQNKTTSVHLSYELEAVSYRQTLAAGENTDFSFLDEIAAEPVVSRQGIDITIYNDGSTEYLIEEKEPQHFAVPSRFDDVLPNDIPPIVKTKIGGGMAYFYDAQGKLVSQH